MIEINYIPNECMFCENPVSAIVVKKRLFGKTKIEVCSECAKEIWEQETNRKLP